MTGSPARARRAPLRARPRCARRLVGDQGTALVEFVLVLPLLILILFAVIDFGKLFSYWLDESHLAGQGARWAVVNNNPGSGVSLQQYIKSQAITEEMKSGGSPSLPAAIEVCISFPTNPETGTAAKVGDPVEVKVRSSYHWMSYLAGSLGPSSTISATTTMRLEQTPTKYSAGCA